MSSVSKVKKHKQYPLKNVLKIYLYDIRHLTQNVIGIVVLMGLVIVPSMYAWFNIAASWDPYGSTSQLKVAVANEDAGYTSDLVSIPINVGNTVESTLRKSDKLDWQFTSRDKAVDGVYSGKYYAAIVIPKNFSAKMMTLFSSATSQAKIQYYINEKSNAIAPKITEKAADTVVTQVSSAFSETIATVALDLAGHVSDFATSDKGTEYVNTAVKRLNSVADDLDATGRQLNSYAELLSAASGLANSAQNIVSTATSGTSDVRGELTDTMKNVKSLVSAAHSSAGSVTAALSAAGKSLDSVSSQLDSMTSNVSSPMADIEQRASTLGGNISSSAQGYANVARALQSVKSDVDSSTALSPTVQSRVSGKLDAQINELNALSSDVSQIGQHISQAVSDAQTAQQNISQEKASLKNQIDAAKKSLTSVKSDYETSVKPEISQLNTQMNATAQQAEAASNSVRTVLNTLRSSGNSAENTVSSVTAAMKDTQTSLSDTASSMRDLAQKLAQGVGAGTSAVSKLTGRDKDALTLAAKLSSPVKLKRNAIYPIANYGSQMAAFYTILAIWVGSIFLVAMMKISISDEEKAHVLGLGSADGLATAVGEGFKPETAANAASLGIGLGSEYWGRYLTFLTVSLLQSGLLAMGDMWYLRVQHVSVWHFFFIAWLASIVFSTIMYALTLAFGAVGKAIAVIIMVMQIAGSGGTFPVELLPPFFQHVYPMLPFPYALTAMHAAIAGSYGMEYWRAMGQLALFLVPALLIGLLVARPLAQSNWLMDQLSKTGVYGE
ncbi:YhgE/Pip family protein [Alloscardovia venturai]|uniref:YhgE/Pip family protein n=1 Tax=Alloscardovia venturai TaxID=1769421 RepID=A0ABW2Y4B6_9BIFI